MLFRFRVYIKSWATLIQFPKLLAQVITLTNFSKVHFKIALKKLSQMVEKIVKTMAFMSMKSFLQSICCEMSPMVRGHATVYSSIEKLSDCLCPQGVILKGLLTERRQILFKNRRLFQWQ